MTRRVTVVSGTRADYGLLRWLLYDLSERDDVELSLVVTGAHLDPAFGETWRVIEADGFEIAERVDILLDADGPAAIAGATAAALTGIADAFARLRPDIVVLLGDRYEILAAAQAAMFLAIPVAHIAGGELTEGAIDDAIRHAITKMSHLHFVAARPYADRVIQLGESPGSVFEVGAIGLDNIDRLDLLGRAELEVDLGISLAAPLALCTFHPETLSGSSAAAGVAPLFEALAAQPALRVVFTKGNADAGGRELNDLVDGFCTEHGDRMTAFTSLGQLRYLSMMGVADLVLGNSSSGIVEAPALGTPTVNIGDRQRGRLRAPSVIDCENDAEAIGAAIRTALSPAFQDLAARRESPFHTAGASGAIARTVATHDLGSIIHKHFHDLGGTS